MIHTATFGGRQKVSFDEGLLRMPGRELNRYRGKSLFTVSNCNDMPILVRMVVNASCETGMEMWLILRHLIYSATWLHHQFLWSSVVNAYCWRLAEEEYVTRAVGATALLKWTILRRDAAFPAISLRASYSRYLPLETTNEYADLSKEHSELQQWLQYSITTRKKLGHS